MRDFENLKIAVAGTGYVGLSIATLLAQHHDVVAVDVVKGKVDLINARKSPIQDDYIEKYLFLNGGINGCRGNNLSIVDAETELNFVVIKIKLQGCSQTNRRVVYTLKLCEC